MNSFIILTLASTCIYLLILKIRRRFTTGFINCIFLDTGYPGGAAICGCVIMPMKSYEEIQERRRAKVGEPKS